MALYPLLTEKQTFFDANSNELSGGKLFVYEANTTSKVTTYAETDGLSANSNPIILNSRGEVPNGLYVDGAAQYKLVLAPSTDTDPPTSPIWTRDDLDPLGYVAQSALSEWQSSGATATQTGAATFTVSGDQRGVFQVGRRVRAVITAAPQLTYGTVSAASFGAGITTVTLSPLTTALDAGLTGTIPDVGLLQSENPSVPWFIDLGLSSLEVSGASSLSGTTINGTLTQTVTSGGDFVVHTSSAAAAEAAMRLTASDATSGIALKLSNSSLNKQATMRGRSDGGITVYVNQTSGGASTSGTHAADIDASGFFNAVRVSENATRVFSRNSANAGSPPAAQTWTAAGVYTFAHGLSGIPDLTSVWLQCTTADLGYSVGDRVYIQGASTGTALSSRLPSVNVAADATNVYVIFNNTPYICNKGTAGNANITASRWDVHVRAWY